MAESPENLPDPRLEEQYLLLPPHTVPRARRGALFTLEAGAEPTLIPLYESWGLQGRLDLDAVDFVQAIFTLCAEDRERLTDMATLEQAYGRSRSTLLKRARDLITLGLMTKDTVSIPGKRTVTRYTVLRADRVTLPRRRLPELPPIPATSDLDAVESERLGELLPEIDLRRLYTVKGELFSIFTLVAALPSGKKGPQTEKPYDCPIRIGREVVLLQVRPTHGTKVASVLDLRILMAVITIIVRRMEKGGSLENPFVIDFDELVDLMTAGDPERKRKGGGKLKLYLLSAIERWEATGFRIARATNGFVDKFRGRIELKDHFRIITKLKVLSYVGAKGKTPGKVALYLDDDLLRRIRDPEMKFLISTHAETLTEQSPFALRFNLWCRRAIKHNHNANRPWSVRWLHGELEPLRPFGEFNKDLKRLYRECYLPELRYARFRGYNFKVMSAAESGERDDHYFIWANPADRLVGQNSHHAFAKRIANEQDQDTDALDG